MIVWFQFTHYCVKPVCQTCVCLVEHNTEIVGGVEERDT